MKEIRAKLSDWRARRRFSRDLAARRVNPAPSTVNIDLTNRCNALCGKCTVRLSDKPKGMMTDEVFEKLVADIKDFGMPIGAVRFEGAGEAILHPRLAHFIRRTRDEKLAKEISIGSNMIGMKPAKLEELLDAGLNMIKMSIDTLDEEEWNLGYGINGFRPAMANIDAAMDIIQRRGGCKIDVKMTLADPFDAHSQAIVKAVSDRYLARVSTLRVTDFHNWAGELHDGKYVRKHSCAQPTNQVTVLWDGQISFCCTDVMRGRFNMGNVQTLSLKDYWFSKELLAIRDIFIKGEYHKIDECNKCDRDTKGIPRIRLRGEL